MVWIIVTILIAIIVIVLMKIIADKRALSIYLNYVPENTEALISAGFLIIMFLLISWIFVGFNFTDSISLKVYGCLLLFNFIISFYLGKLIAAFYYKKSNYSIDYLKRRIELDKINDKNNKNKLNSKEKLIILSTLLEESEKNKQKTKNAKLEKEMDYYHLNEHERELVRKGDYDPWNFEYPENEEPLDEDDYYSDDDSWKNYIFN